MKLFTVLAACCTLVAAVPVTSDDPPKCTTPEKRVSWHDVSKEDKQAYLTAQKCVMTTPAKLKKLPGAKTRWDEIVSLHQIMALQIHSTGVFLPFHRYFLHVHKALLMECGYKGALPYWDEPRDAGKFTSSPVFDTTLGFGGTGKGAQNCVPNGPFTNTTVSIGPGFTSAPRCVNRSVQNAFSSSISKAAVATAINVATYDKAWLNIYSGPHLTGHIALSMMNGDSITSPGDPLFMMHHGFVDKMWWDWQKVDLTKRLTDMSGPNAQDPATGFIEFPNMGGIEGQSKMWGKPTAEMKAVTPNPQSGDNGTVTTLNHVLTSLGIIPDTTIKEIMDIRGGYLCYEYV